MSLARKVSTQSKGLFKSITEFAHVIQLGTGSFGSVHLYQHLITKTNYAVKIILGTTITNQYEQEGIEREIRVHFQCAHHYIVKLYDSFFEDDNIYLILEYVPNGNLFSFIQKNRFLSEEDACRTLVQITLALDYLHKANVYHRDIKPENILLDENFDIKLCDFGWCAENIHQKRKTFCGTYEYMAPEIVSDVPYDYTIDIWAIGILLFEMVHGSAPFKGKEFSDIASNIKKDPALRPSIKTILASPFVKFCRMNLITQSEECQENSLANESKIYLSPKPYQKPSGRLKSPAQKTLHQISTIKLLHKQSNSLANIFTSVSPSKVPNRKESKQFFQSPKARNKQTPLKDQTAQISNGLSQQQLPHKFISLQGSQQKAQQENLKPMTQQKKTNSKRGKASLYNLSQIKLYTQQSPPRRFADSPKQPRLSKKKPTKRVFIGLFE